MTGVEVRGGACVVMSAWWCVRGGECVVVSAWLRRNVERELLQAGIGTSTLCAPDDIGSAACRRNGLRHFKNHL